MQICNPTTPAQMFHLLRRQALNHLIKPLIVFTPKGLLRHPLCTSRVEDLATGTFEEILDDPKKPKNPKRIALCSGRIYYDLIQQREKSKVEDLAIIRLEQLYPLNFSKLKAVIDQYQGFEECLWVQEEPSNMGPWHYIHPRLDEVLPEGMEPKYIGRKPSASPAAGSHALHQKEHTLLMNAVFKSEEQPFYEMTYDQIVRG